MARKKLKTISATATDSCAAFIQRMLPLVTGWLILLVSISFFTSTYDSAYVKLTLLQIGSVLLLTLWSSLKIIQRRNPFTRRHLLFLAPLLIYLAWQTLSFLCFPYKLEAAEEFIRLWMYGAISCLIACEFTIKDVQTVTRFIVITAWVSFLYGALQILNIWLPGADLLPWHGFFGNRVFSTHANPNFFGAFIVFSSAVITAEFLRTRHKNLLVLLGLGILNLVFTESKGAWLAYAATAVFFVFTYTHCLVSLKKHLRKINLLAVILLLVACIGAGIYSSKRFQSVSFRTYTWLSAFEMVKDSPILGTGPGSFKLVYPAYRRPQIFYIENSHNNETQHAENEYLEQAATGGIIGLALFLWLITFLFTGSFKALRAKIPSATDKEKRSHLADRRWYLLGYLSALAGLLVHTFVDISIHFASSGLLLAVFIGILLALLLDNPSTDELPFQAPKHKYTLWTLRGLVIAAVAATACYMSVHFYHILHNTSTQNLAQYLLSTLSVLSFTLCVIGTIFLYVRVVLKTTRIAVCALLLLSLPLCIFPFRFFVGNHYYSLGVALVQMGQLHAAVGAFSDAIKFDPFLSEYRQYRANIFAATLNLSKRFVPDLGDTDRPRTDFERAQADLAFVFKHNPNHARLNLDTGRLHYILGTQQLGQAQLNPLQSSLYQQMAEENLAQAHRYLVDALRLDPTDANTYTLLINLALLKHDFAQAQAWVDTYYKGPAGVTEEEFLEKHRQDPQMQAVQAHINRLKAGRQ